MDDDYYLPQGPLHEQNRLISETPASSSDYLSYSLPEYHQNEKTPKKYMGKSKQQHHRIKTSSSKNKTQITEKEAKEAIMRGLVTETDDVDISKLSGRTNLSSKLIFYRNKSFKARQHCHNKVVDLVQMLNPHV